MPGRHSLPMLLQSEAAECGLACLAMVASFHGYQAELNELRHRFRVTLKGTTFKDLDVFSRALGLTARAVRLEPEALGRLECPAILHFDMNHFVVLKETRGDTAVVHDPALGVRKLSRARIDRRFTGVAMELRPNEIFRPKPARAGLTLADLGGRLAGERTMLAKALLLSLVVQLLVLAVPLYVQLAIDRAVGQTDASTLVPLAIGFGIILVLRAAISWLRAEVLLAFGGLFSARAQTRVIQHLLSLPSRWFENRHVGAILSRIASTQPIKDLIAEGVVGAVVDGLMAALTIGAAALFSPKLASIVLAGFLISAGLKWWQVERSLEREHEQVEAQAKVQQELIETVRGITSIKLAGKETARLNRWFDRNVEAVNSRHALEKTRSAAEIGRDIAQQAVLGLIVYVGATDVVADRSTLGIMMAFIAYQQTFSASATRLLDFAGRIRMLDVHLQRLADVMLAEPETQVDTARLPDSRLGGSVCARGLAFRYGESEPTIFRNVSLDVGPGEFVAITGPSGGGKTTLLKLLLGLLEPTEGEVLYDDQPFGVLGAGRVRRDIGVIIQDDVLLSGSLAQNISFFASAPDPAWIEECARTAAIHDDIARFPMGYNTLIGDMGSVLSTGQRQRVLLARALYRRPKILFMDEGTSSLDTEKELEVNANLRELSITRIIIAHRKDTIDAADRVMELTPSGLVPRTRIGAAAR